MAIDLLLCSLTSACGTGLVALAALAVHAVATSPGLAGAALGALLVVALTWAPLLLRKAPAPC